MSKGLDTLIANVTAVTMNPKMEVIFGAYIGIEDGKIVSMAEISAATPDAMKIAAVYTRPAYRGKGLARLVVNTAKNETLAQGKIATLNVDKKNPITNHLYRSLGFKPVFSQGEYRRK